jgi:hypothetical protein
MRITGILILFILCSSSIHGQCPIDHDTLDYAPGYPAYSVSQLDQLQHFPSPRFSSTHAMHRNFSWYDFLYIGYDYSQVYWNAKTNVFVYPGMNKKPHADLATALNKEMYDHWNYYFNIPTPSYNFYSFTKTETIAGSAAKFANDHPEVKTCTYIFWAGLRMKSFGYDTPKSYINYRENIDPCGDTTYPKIADDGLVQRKCLRYLTDALPRRDSLCKIDFINENGERFGDVWTPNGEGYRGNPFISCIQPDSDNARALRARWQYHVFNTYRRQFIGNDSLPGLKNTQFSFYQVAGFLPLYYSEWNEMKYINYPLQDPGFDRGKGFHSTPDFYPGKADHNIFDRYAAYHGIDCIAEGRKYELKNGDDYFSPFMCAGWFADSMNYRPAEWLAASKVMCAMGADFFYGAYFNEVNPAKTIPNDPRGFIYQVAMLSYAQAVTSRYYDIFINSADFDYQKKKNTLCIVRKEKGMERYMIDASVFHDDDPKDYKDLAVTVDVGGQKIKVNARKQGSVYIYDKTDSSNIVFYQLDGWHEATHPYYWSKNIEIEGENFDDSAFHPIHTERPANAEKNDYTNFTSYVDCKDPVGYSFETGADTATYYIWIRVRCSPLNPGKEDAVSVRLDGGTISSDWSVPKEEFKWYCVKGTIGNYQMISYGDHLHTLQVRSLNRRSIDVDKILISTEEHPAEVK